MLDQTAVTNCRSLMSSNGPASGRSRYVCCPTHVAALVFHAQRSYYEQLLRAGVKIYLYRAPTILHAKHLSIDDDVAVIGSSNLDIRSLSLHMELSVLVHGAKFTAAMRAVEDDYRSKSRQVVLQDWLRRPTRERIFDNLMRLTSSLQ